MQTEVLFAGIAGLQGDTVGVETLSVHLYVSTTQPSRCCPVCHTPSAAIHSRYWRTLADLPLGGRRAVLHLRTRRFFCRVTRCRRRIFTERLPTLMAPWAVGAPHADVLEDRDRTAVAGLCQACPEVAQAYALAQRFAQMVRTRQADSLDAWLEDAQQGPRELRSVASSAGGCGLARPAPERPVAPPLLQHDGDAG